MAWPKAHDIPFFCSQVAGAVPRSHAPRATVSNFDFLSEQVLPDDPNDNERHRRAAGAYMCKAGADARVAYVTPQQPN